MKTTQSVVITTALMAAILIGLLIFGFSDFFSNNHEVWSAKPWRPWARLIFSIVMIGIVAFFGTAAIRLWFRNK